MISRHVTQKTPKHNNSDQPFSEFEQRWDDAWTDCQLEVSDLRPGPRVKSPHSLAKLEDVDITSTAPEDSKSLHWLDDLGHTDLETVEL